MKQIIALSLAGLSLLLLLFAGCTGEAPRVQQLNPREAQALLEQKDAKNLFVLNVHTPYEGEIEGTDAFIEDWQGIAAHQDQLPKDKRTPVLVYCRSGRMSTSAVEQLKGLGYTDIYHLEGGMLSWEQEGLTLMRKQSSQ